MNDKLVATSGSSDAAAGLVPDPLTELKRWPSACRPGQPCEIDGVTYPAPAELGAADVLWWIDVTQLRVNASRSLVSGWAGALKAALVGSLATAMALFVAVEAALGPVPGSTSVWVVLGAVAAVWLLPAVLLWLIRDNEHRPLEQRLLLYRQWARDLDVL